MITCIHKNCPNNGLGHSTTEPPEDDTFTYEQLEPAPCDEWTEDLHESPPPNWSKIDL